VKQKYVIISRGVVLKKEMWERRSHTNYKRRLHQQFRIK